METPFFSIIIPTFNSEKTLFECLRSVISQSFKDFEVLIIDGVSTDSTLKISSSFNDKRIKAFSSSDHGIYDAMNKGIKLATGDWLYFLGSDDNFYDNNVLKAVYDSVNVNHFPDIIYGNVMTSNNTVYDGYFDTRKFLLKNICHQSIFYSKKILIKIGGYDLKYKCLSDYDLNIKWFFDKKVKVVYIDSIIARYSMEGFSTFNYNNDQPFYEDLPFKFLKHGNFRLTNKELRINIKYASETVSKKRKYLFWILLKFIHLILRFLHLINGKVLIKLKK